MQRFRTARVLAGILGGLSLLALGAEHASADIISTLNTVTGSTGAYNWNYAANVSPDQKVTTGDYFEIRDFNGFNGTHSEPTGWTFSTAMVGPLPPGLISTSDPTVPDLIWTYSGTDPIKGPLSLGTFTAGSTIGAQGASQFVAVGTRQGGPGINTKISNIGSEVVPLLSPMAPSPAGAPEVPEPSTLLLLGVGLPVAAGLWRRRRMAAA